MHIKPSALSVRLDVNRELSPRSALLLALIQHTYDHSSTAHSDCQVLRGKRWVRISNAEFQEILGYSPTTITKSLQALESHSLIEMANITKDKGDVANWFTVSKE
ncbi:putative tail protein [Vibrio phage vB_VpaS_SD15]|nr:putative tail protein [Vibrio phage vB_VpaS_SD15]